MGHNIMVFHSALILRRDIEKQNVLFLKVPLRYLFIQVKISI